MSGPCRRPAALLAAATLAAIPAAALDPRKAVTQYSLDVWEAEQGLPESSVQAVTQTRDGYLWIGTQEGFLRFDGVRFTVFDRHTAGLQSNYIQALLEARDGSLWIGTGGGGLTRMQGRTFTTFRQGQGLTSDVIWSLCEDRDGSLWIGTAGGGLVRYRGGRFDAYGPERGLHGASVLALTLDRSGALWIGTDGGGLHRFANGSFERLTTKQGLSHDTVYAVLEDRAGTLWAGTEKGLDRIRDGRITAYGKREGLAYERVDALVEDRDGSLWLGTEGGGLFRFRDGRFEALTSRDGLSSDIVRTLFEDREGSLWVGSRGGGLSRLKDGRVTTYGLREGLSSDVVWSLYEDRGGDLWIATDGGGLDRFRDGRITSYTTANGLSHNQVRSLAEDRGGALWIGTWGGGLNRYRDGKFRVYRKEDSGLSHNFIRAIYEDRSGALWVGTYGGGLNRLENGRFSVYTTREGLANDTVYCILQDRGGALWIGTRGGGLSRYENGRFRTFARKEGLPDEVVLSLYEDAEGALWIGTTGGLARFKQGRFASATSRDGLYDDLAYQILEDDRGNLWMSCNRGIYRVARRDFDDFAAGRIPTIPSVGYGRADGMKSAECNGGVQPAGWKTRDGRLWFPTIRGVAMIDPRTLAANTRTPPVVIEEVLNDRQRVEAGPAPRLPPGRGELEFHYTALTFVAPEHVRFRYRLEGFDPDWVDAGPRRAAFYTNLPPGDYRFRVAAANEEGVWGPEAGSFAFTLTPPFYRTLWFRALSALGLALLAAGLYGLRVRSLRARQRELQRLVDERTRDLRAAIRLKDEVVSIVAHDFRSPLTLIQGYAEMLLTKSPDDDARKSLGIILAHSNQLATLASATLTMSRIETGDFPLERRPVDLAQLTRAIAGARDGSVRVEAPDAPLVVTGDEGRLGQVFENLVGNALKYSRPGAPVDIRLEAAAEGVHVAVRDEGIGIAPDEMPRLFQRFSRLGGARSREIPGTGLGLYICRSIVEAHGGRIWAESQPGRGSTFHVVLPR